MIPSLQKQGNKQLNALRKDIEELFWEGVRSATPEYLSPEFWNNHPDLCEVFKNPLKKNYVFALGKAAYAMALSFQKFFPVEAGFILTTQPSSKRNPKKRTNGCMEMQRSRSPHTR